MRRPTLHVQQLEVALDVCSGYLTDGVAQVLHEENIWGVSDFVAIAEFVEERVTVLGTPSREGSKAKPGADNVILKVPMDDHDVVTFRRDVQANGFPSTLELLYRGAERGAGTTWNQAKTILKHVRTDAKNTNFFEAGTREKVSEEIRKWQE